MHSLFWGKLRLALLFGVSYPQNSLACEEKNAVYKKIIQFAPCWGVNSGHLLHIVLIVLRMARSR
jgi:hypothetical protein